MKLVLPGINNVFDCSANDFVNAVIIENQTLFYDILCDLDDQLNGNEGKAVLSEDNKVLSTDKYLELHSVFVPFELNRKSLLSKLIASLNEIAMDETHYVETMELIGTIEKYLYELASNVTGDIEFMKISVESFLKASGIGFVDDYTSIAEKLLDYMELVEEYGRHKLFVFINLRSYVPDVQMEEFIDTALLRNYQILFIDSSEHTPLKREKRYIVDENLCEMC